MPFLYHQRGLNVDGTVQTGLIGTDFSSFNPLSIFEPPTPPVTRQWLNVWANHARDEVDARHNPPVVIFNGKEYRFKYTTIAKANAATIANLRGALVSAAAAKAVCTNNGLRYVSYGDLTTLWKQPKSGYNFIDVCYCPPFVYPWINGFMLDYECADDRPPATTRALFARITSEFGFMKRMLYTNAARDEGDYEKSGMWGSESAALSNFNYVSILSHNNVDDLDEQHARFSDSRKVYVTLAHGGSTQSTFNDVKAFVQARQLAGVNIWPNGADLFLAANQTKTATFSSWL